MQEEYGESYYNNYDIGCKTVSYLESPELRSFLASVAKEVTERFHPQMVLDAGCAMGVLVSEFIKQGVEAYGLDSSEYAVKNADSLAVKNCFHGSLAEPFPEGMPQKFDLVTCMEVLEHMSPEDGRCAIANLCKVTDTIIFCSTPDDFEDKTHINVQEREYWASLFAENGFFDDLSCRPLFITDYAVCYRRRADWQGQVRDYERFIRDAERMNRESHEQYLALKKEHEKAVAEWTKANAALEEADAELAGARWECEEAERQIELQREQCAALDSDYQSAMRKYKETCNLLTEAIQRADTLENSRSWRLLAPIREAKRTIKCMVGKTARKLYHVLKWVKNRTVKPKLLRKNWPPRVEAVMEEGACAVQLRCRRIGIYTFYDKDGIVDDYVLYYLKALLPWVEKLFVVCNGQLTQESSAALKSLGCEVLVRENSGFDAWGIKAAIEKLGFEALSQYDEAVISNSTFFGPLYGFDKIFAQMSDRKVDFWGISEHPKYSYFDAIKNLEVTIPRHIQSYFYCVRKRMLAGEAFQKFWTNMPKLPDYSAAVSLYETTMTQFFADAGYQWGCLMDREAYSDLTINPLITMPLESARDWGCPFFKRRAFFQDYLYLTAETGHQSTSVLLRYIREETNYPVELAWKNLIRTCHMCDLTQNLHLSRTFSKEDFCFSSEIPLPRAALFMHIYDHTMAVELAGYAANLPPEVDIYISTVSEEKKDAILRAFQNLPNSLEIRVLPNRGRDVSALLTSFRDVVMNYEVACVTHDKKTEFLEPKTVGEGFAYMGYENILGSRAFVTQILREFSRDPFLGLLCAPDPNHADFCSHIGLEWCGNYSNVVKLAAELGLHVPMDEDHPPVAPYGSSFWFRTAAMAPLFRKEWTYEDFPSEPLEDKDGTIMHAIERIYPYVAQHSGYYSAMVMTTDYAAVEIGNLSYYAGQYGHMLLETGRIPSSFNLAVVESYCEACLGSKEHPAGKAHAWGKERIMKKIRGKLKVWAEL